MKKYLRVIFLKNLKCWLIITASFVIFGICNSFLKVNNKNRLLKAYFKILELSLQFCSKKYHNL